MSDMKQVVGTKSALTVSGLATAASGTYKISDAVNNTTNQPLDIQVELTITPGTVTGNKQALLFMQASLDGTNYQGGGTSATDEIVLTQIGVLPLPINATSQRVIFSLLAGCGFMPPYFKLVVKNDSGSAFTAGTINLSEVKVTVT